MLTACDTTRPCHETICLAAYRREPSRAVASGCLCAVVVIWRMLAVEQRTGRPGAARRRHPRSSPRRRRRHAAARRPAPACGCKASTRRKPCGKDSPSKPGGRKPASSRRILSRAPSNRVRLTFGLERKDRHDRFLAFVWNGDVMLNEELVRAGLAACPARLSLQRPHETPTRNARRTKPAGQGGEFGQRTGTGPSSEKRRSDE